MNVYVDVRYIDIDLSYINVDRRYVDIDLGKIDVDLRQVHRELVIEVVVKIKIELVEIGVGLFCMFRSDVDDG